MALLWRRRPSRCRPLQALHPRPCTRPPPLLARPTHPPTHPQARDLRMANGFTGREFEVERRSEVFRQSWVQDAAMKYLQKRGGAGV